MPVTIKVAGHDANAIAVEPRENVESVLRSISREAGHDMHELLQSSVQDSDRSNLVPTHNGFVDCCMQAYNTHQNLVIRPDDLWITIVSCPSFL